MLEMAEEVKHTDREENGVNGCCKDVIGYIAGDLGLIKKEHSLSEELPLETEDI
ncbi:hypothetical protein J437_LFUL003950 [Ladona fulva]|uniref:Uncharacterized protein n=1 Tax=Ladona fulva TaxID=123851 RepID=A0A8K0P2U8_LADFU|nr:hypothetical protein J437_LFUL003950 [Ladona fulva]